MNSLPLSEDLTEKTKKKYNLINDETRKKVVEMVEINNASLKEVIFFFLFKKKSFFFMYFSLKGLPNVRNQTVDLQSHSTSFPKRRQIREKEEKNKKRQQYARENSFS